MKTMSVNLDGEAQQGATNVIEALKKQTGVEGYVLRFGHGGWYKIKTSW